MASPFSRSMRALEADGFRRWGVTLALAALVLAGWGAWFLLARVAVYEVSRAARLESTEEAHPVDARVAGRVVATRLEVGRVVKKGELLAEVESDTQRLQLAEEEARLRIIAPQLEAALGEIRSERRALGHAKQGVQETLEEARARHREATAAKALADAQLVRRNRLLAGGHVSASEVDQARADAHQRKAAAEALALAVGRLEWDQRIARSDRRTRVQHVRRDLAVLQGEVQTRRATIARLRFEIEKHRIVAPIAGRLGEVSLLRVGSVLKEGDRLCTVVPPGGVKVVADFLPAGAVGRVKAGQSARLRMDGFPWAQYGIIAAEVMAVSSEPRNGQIRVELRLGQTGPTPIPLQHGLPGSVEVEIERVSPATLVLRAAGQLLSGEAAAPALPLAPGAPAAPGASAAPAAPAASANRAN